MKNPKHIEAIIESNESLSEKNVRLFALLEKNEITQDELADIYHKLAKIHNRWLSRFYEAADYRMDVIKHGLASIDERMKFSLAQHVSSFTNTPFTIEWNGVFFTIVFGNQHTIEVEAAMRTTKHEIKINYDDKTEKVAKSLALSLGITFEHINIPF